jgi:uncharacterized protein (TIGR02246 family)
MNQGLDPAEQRDADAIAEANAAVDRALMASDPDAVAAMFTEDGVLSESGLDDLVGRAAIRDFLAQANTVRTVTFHRLIREELDLFGDRAIERAAVEETKVKPGLPPIHERGRVVTYWRRNASGGWRIARIIASDLAPSP